MRFIALGCLSLLLFAAEPAAAWVEASSDHFVIYSDQSEGVVKDFAERLERFDSAMRYAFGKPDVKLSPSNRVTVFVVGNRSKVRKVVGAQDRFLAGVYIGRAGGSVAVVPKLRNGSWSDMSGATVLYHEYAHHFMSARLTARAFPRWFTEGFAEFFGGVRFKSDGSVVLGAPATYRYAELVYAPEVPIRTFLDFDGGAADAKARYNAFYGQSWVLFHYLQMAPERNGQLAEYQRKLAAGQPALQAAENAFGDLAQLEKDLDQYMRRPRMSAMVINHSVLTTGSINVRKLRAGEAAMMPIMIESKVGVSRDEALALAPEARKVAALHPKDPAVLSALAEAEFDAGELDAAIAAADAALALDPQNINAHLQKGYALARKIENGTLPKESWKDVRSQFARANRVENDHPIPLVHFYLSYVRAGEQPTENSIEGLEWALQLAPYDAQLRWLVVQQMVSDERFDLAAKAVAPLAYSPHPGEHTEQARKLLKEIEAKLEASQEPS